MKRYVYILRNILLKIPRWIKYKKIRKDMKVKYEGSIIKKKLDSNKKTIILVSHSFEKGGASVLLKHISYELRDNNFQVIIIGKNYGELIDDFQDSGIVYVCENKKELSILLKQIEFLNVNKCICNSIASCEFIPTLKQYGYEIISLIHEMPETIQYIDAVKYAKIAASQSDAIIFPSTIVRDRFFTHFVIGCKVYVKPQGLYLSTNKDIDRYNSKEYILKKYQLDKKKPIVLNVATSNYRKGFDCFVNIAEMDKNRNYIWVGYIDNNYTKNILRNKQIKNLSLIGYVDSKEELLRFYNCADLFILTSRDEPFGSVVIESFANGVPVIAFNYCGGFVDIVEDNVTGYLVENYDYKEMLNAISNYFENESFKYLSNNCIDTAKKMNFGEYVSYIIDKF